MAILTYISLALLALVAVLGFLMSLLSAHFGGIMLSALALGFVLYALNALKECV